jgi:hypothetical protein
LFRSPLEIFRFFEKGKESGTQQIKKGKKKKKKKKKSKSRQIERRGAKRHVHER